MKTQIRPIIWFLSALALFSAANNASAYYDPGVQKWINRDPVGQRGGLNVYAFVVNNSVGLVDPLGFGRQGPGSLAPGEDDGCPDGQHCASQPYPNGGGGWLCPNHNCVPDTPPASCPPAGQAPQPGPTTISVPAPPAPPLPLPPPSPPEPPTSPPQDLPPDDTPPPIYGPPIIFIGPPWHPASPPPKFRPPRRPPPPSPPSF